MKITILQKELKKNKLITNLLLILVSFYPISIVAGPALVELTIFFTIVLFILSYKKEIIKFLYLTSEAKKILIFYVGIIVSSLFSDNILISLKSSLFSIRFFLFTNHRCIFL
jgi:hypothetical protein